MAAMWQINISYSYHKLGEFKCNLESEADANKLGDSLNNRYIERGGYFVEYIE